MPTRILVVGAGAIGAFFGSRLASLPNVRVSALCRSNYNAVKTNGFRVTSPKYKECTLRPEYVFQSHRDASAATVDWDYLLVATKVLPELSDDSKLLEGLVGPKTSIILMQNGLGIEEPHHKRFPRAFILSAVTRASVESHGAVIAHKKWTRTTVGPYLPHDTDRSFISNAIAEESTRSASHFVDLLTAGGIADAELLDHSSMQAARWHKTAINAAINPSSVLSGGSSNMSMSTDAEVYRHLLAVMREVLETSVQVLGKPLPPSLPTPEEVLKGVQRDESGSKASMLLDWERGQRLELEVILGNPIRMAREKGIEMPRLQSMYALLKMAQQKRESERPAKF